MFHFHCHWMLSKSTKKCGTIYAGLYKTHKLIVKMMEREKIKDFIKISSVKTDSDGSGSCTAFCTSDALNNINKKQKIIIVISL
jgi:hypothetical protein